MRDNWLSNRVFKNYDDILDHCCLEQSCLTEHNLHRDTKMGPWVLNCALWYYLSAAHRLGR